MYANENYTNSIPHINMFAYNQMNPAIHLIPANYVYGIGPIIYGQPPFKQWRKGKWTEEEEKYTKALVLAFTKGILDLPEGTTLRSFLSSKLNW